MRLVGLGKIITSCLVLQFFYSRHALAQKISTDNTELITVDGIVATLENSLLDIWGNFIDQIPYLTAGLIVLVITAISASVIGRVFRKLAKKSSLRPS